MIHLCFQEINAALFNIAYKELVLCLEQCEGGMYDWDEYDDEYPQILIDSGDFSYYFYIHQIELVGERIKIYCEGSETHESYELWLDEEIKDPFQIRNITWTFDDCGRDSPVLLKAQEIIDKCANDLNSLL